MTRKRTMILASLTAAAALLTWASPAALAAGHGDKGCAKCHVPHNAHADTAVPLWNPEEHATELTEATYNSPTMQATGAGATADTVTGTSLLCLSCHDGSHSAAKHEFGADSLGAGDTEGMGSLAASHPIGIVYDQALATADGELVDPATLAPGVLDTEGKVGCASCHDPHASASDVMQEDGSNAYLRWGYRDDAHGTPGGDTRSDDFCRHCHVK